jgi:hypothetical protein
VQQNADRPLSRAGTRWTISHNDHFPRQTFFAELPTSMTTDSTTPGLSAGFGEGFGASDPAEVVERLERFAYWSDDCIPVPGLDARIGLDPLIGLVPVWGDVIAAVVSCYVPFAAYRIGAPPSLIFKMLVLIIADALSGYIPVAGDLIDAAVKANKMNVEMLKDHLGA